MLSPGRQVLLINVLILPLGDLKKNIICKLIEVLDVNNVLIIVGEKPSHIFQDKEIISNTNGAPSLHSLTSFLKRK